MTTLNAASILTAIGIQNDIPLYAGAACAISRPPMHNPTDIHGESGLDGTDLLPQPLKVPNLTEDAIEAMAAALLAQPAGTAVVVATGALTNIATLFRKHPHLVFHIKALSIMGGCFGGGFTEVSLGKVDDTERVGNYTPYAEFNIIADPEAAAAIFNDKDLAEKTTVIPLDLTHQVLATTDVRDLLLYGEDGEKTGRGKTTLRQMLLDLLMYFAKTYAHVYGITAGPPMHDPLAVAVALIGTPHEIPFYDFDPRDSEGSKEHERFSVKVETEGTYEDALAGKTQTGRTILTKLEPGSKGVTIPRGLDTDQFWKVLEECIQEADATVAGKVTRS